MPNCFQLFRKGEKEAATLSSVDKAICDHFKEDCDPKYYYKGWFDAIGFSIAMGASLGSKKLKEQWPTKEEISDLGMEEARAEWERRVSKWPEDEAHMQRMGEIRLFLEREYTDSAWAEIGRRTLDRV